MCGNSRDKPRESSVYTLELFTNIEAKLSTSTQPVSLLKRFQNL